MIKSIELSLLFMLGSAIIKNYTVTNAYLQEHEYDIGKIYARCYTFSFLTWQLSSKCWLMAISGAWPRGAGTA